MELNFYVIPPLIFLNEMCFTQKNNTIMSLFTPLYAYSPVHDLSCWVHYDSHFVVVIA